MDLFTLIMNYINDYILGPIDSYFGESLSVNGYYLGDYYFIVHKGQLSIVNNSNVVDGDYYLVGMSLYEILNFIITFVIFILLFIVCVKFIVWLFKQISFVTRF